ncbi:UNVERIFIED_CONTAM: hypothetical protein PYX00_008297 [Menopon gallinae]|uniref:Transmembrane protein 161B n=2 Tax=Menopon gallinae TaxID=328185 RepID=A0AAW2HNI2_9NEOP
MALLGPQLVITLIMVSFIQKLGNHLSLAKWMLCSTGLTRYLYPTDEELRSLAGIHKSNKGNKKGRHGGGGGGENGKVNDTFHIPRNLDIHLQKSKVMLLDIIHLRFYSEYQWLLDFSVYATVVYFLTESCQIFFKIKDEVNLSMLWCILVVGFASKILISLTRQYFKCEESGERSTVIVTGFAYMLLAMMVLIVDENNLELGLETAYKSFSSSAALFLEKQGLDSSGPASKIVLKFFLALWCGLIGALFTFPGLRTARMHWDALQHYKDRKGLRLILNISFAMPFILTLLWIKPISRDYLTVRVFQGMKTPIMTTSAFESLRLILIIFSVCLRFVLMPIYLQCYLNMANERMENMKKEAGRITNTDLQKRIAAVFYYLCVVALQYTAPLLICLFFTFMYKTLGGFTWLGTSVESSEECPLTPPTASDNLRAFNSDGEPSISESAQQFTLALESLKDVFTAEVFRGLFGLTTWWTCFALFATSSMGIVYQSYFSHL